MGLGKVLFGDLVRESQPAHLGWRGCPVCRASVLPEARFCGHCGALVPPVVVPVKRGWSARRVLGVLLGIAVGVPLCMCLGISMLQALTGGGTPTTTSAIPTAVPVAGPTWHGAPLYPTARLYQTESSAAAIFTSGDDVESIDAWYRREWPRAGFRYVFDYPQSGYVYHVYERAGSRYAYAVLVAGAGLVGIAMLDLR